MNIGSLDRLLESLAVAAVHAASVGYVTVALRAATKLLEPPTVDVNRIPLRLEFMSAVIEELYRPYFKPVPEEPI